MDFPDIVKAVLFLALIFGLTVYLPPMCRRWKAILLIIVVCAYIAFIIFPLFEGIYFINMAKAGLFFLLYLIFGLTVYLPPMRRRWIMILSVVVVYYASAIFLFCVLPYDAGVEIPSGSIASAKSRGSFISEARFEPMTVHWNGIDLEFDEVWIEEGMGIKPNFLFLPYEKRQGWYFLCFSFRNKVDDDKVHFSLENPKGKRSPLDDGYVNGWKERQYKWNERDGYCSKDIPYPGVFDLHLYVRKSWKEKERFEVSIRP